MVTSHACWQAPTEPSGTFPQTHLLVMSLNVKYMQIAVCQVVFAMNANVIEKFKV